MADMRMPDPGAEADLVRDPESPALGDVLPRPDSTAPAGLIPLDHQLPESSSPSHLASTDGAADPELARREIVQTRSRMSDTIDQIEEQLLRRKERLQAQLDVRGQLRERLTPVRELVERQPLAVFGGVLGLGLAIGYLTGGGDDGRADPLRGEELDIGARSGWRRNARRWEARSRELMRINAELEEEVRRLREDLGDGLDAESGWLSGVSRAVGSLFGRGGGTEVETVVDLVDDDLPGDYHPSASYDHFSESQRVREPEDPLQG